MKLKPSSYAILGQLAFHPWSAYELIKEMQRNFHYFYPRAESGLYEELKKLEQNGYTTSEVETKGKKDRTVYRLTEQGKQALKEWLATEPDPYSLEFDGLLRMFLSKFGTQENLSNSLNKIRTDADILINLAEKVGNEYITGTAPSQSEIAQRVCIFDFLLHYGMLYKEWLDRTEKYLKEIESLREDEVSDKAQRLFKEHLQKFGLKVQ